MESWPQNPEFRINPENFHPGSTLAFLERIKTLLMSTKINVIIECLKYRQLTIPNLNHVQNTTQKSPDSV